MITEIAEIRINPADQDAFEKAMEQALGSYMAKAQGVKGYKLFRCIESMDRYVLQVQWEKWEDHMITYLRSPQRKEMRALIGEFFTQPVAFQHFTMVTER